MTDRFGHGTLALEVVEGLDLSDIIAVVTGAASGLGIETVRALASAGATLILPVRSLERGSAVADEVKASTGNDRVTVMEMDLIDPDSIRAFATAFLATHDRIDILINNAGIMAGPLVRSAKGYESQFATNHLGHFLMTGLLAPALLNAASPRVVALSSLGHRISPVVFEDINFESRDYDKWLAYGQSKTANALFAVELNKRLAAHGGQAFSVHPGGIMTGLQKDLTQEEMSAMGWFDEDGKPSDRFKVPAGGASTAVWAATTSDLADRGGAYCEDCHLQIVFL